MKIIIIIVILIIVYLIFRQVKVYPKKEVPENVTKKGKPTIEGFESKTENYFYNSDKEPIFRTPRELAKKQLQTEDFFKGSEKKPQKTTFTKSKKLPDARDVMKVIQEEYMDTQYRFNMTTQPITTIIPTKYNKDVQKKYLERIAQFVKSWNDIFPKGENPIKLSDINLLFIQETMDEFLLKANIKIMYLGKSLHMKASFYGWLEKTDDPFTEADAYKMQMIEILPIPKGDYGEIPEGNSSSWDDTFATYERDRAHAKKINDQNKHEHFNTKRE